MENEPQIDELDIASRFASLTDDAATLTKSAKALLRITRSLSKPEGYESLKKLQRDLALLRDLTLDPGDLLARAQAAAEVAGGWLDSEWDRRAASFADELAEYFTAREVAIEADGLALRAAPLAIRLVPAADRALLTYAGETVRDGLPLRASRIYDEWRRAEARLARESTAPSDFADALIAAYDTQRLVKKRQGPARIRLSEIHFQLFVGRQTFAVQQDPRKSRVKEYPRYQFAWDLAALLESPDLLERAGRTIEVLPAAETAARSRGASVRCPLAGQNQSFSDLRVTGDPT